jgi:peptidoglycan biosynthesis protein MviN/MurJ (putative lipid II flippase)
MSKYTDKDSERDGWLCMIVFFVLLSSHEIADILFGRGWAVVVAAIAAVLWLVVRPWRFGLLPDHTRRQLRLMGIVALFGFVAVMLIRFWRA